MPFGIRPSNVRVCHFTTRADAAWNLRGCKFESGMPESKAEEAAPARCGNETPKAEAGRPNVQSRTFGSRNFRLNAGRFCLFAFFFFDDQSSRPQETLRPKGG